MTIIIDPIASWNTRLYTDTMYVPRTVNGKWRCGEDAGFWFVQLDSAGL